VPPTKNAPQQTAAPVAARATAATPRTVATAATKVTSASTRLNAAATRAATSAKTLTSALTAITTATKALEAAAAALNDAARALAAPARPAARATPPKTAAKAATPAGTATGKVPRAGTARAAAKVTAGKSAPTGAAATPTAGAGMRDAVTGKGASGKAAKKAGKAAKAEKPRAKSKSASPKENGRALAGLSRLRRCVLLLSAPGLVRDPVRGGPFGRASGGTVLDMGMAIDGEYVPSPRAWVRDQVKEYEGSGGTAGTTLRETGLPVVIVTNTGAKTGAVRKTPLMRVEHAGDYAAVGSQGGAPKNPVWVYNLRANPRVVVQDGAQTWAMTAREVAGAERDVWWDRAVAAYPPYAEYQQKTDRMIPVFVLERAGA
jgi:deazaflavin-dependent oxidoreductase (nitroreductase family)